MSIVLTPRLIKALNVVALVHDGHYRKGTTIPYVSHLYGVMYVASRQGLPGDLEEDVLIACLLHDTLEDVPERYSIEQLRADFGPRVAGFVQSVTKDNSLEDWRERAEAYLAELRRSDFGVVVVSACDKLHNLTSILEDYREVGDELWSRFSCGKRQQQWWYAAVLEVVEQRAPRLPLVREYRAKVRDLAAL